MRTGSSKAIRALESALVLLRAAAPTDAAAAFVEVALAALESADDETPRIVVTPAQRAPSGGVSMRIGLDDDDEEPDR